MKRAEEGQRHGAADGEPIARSAFVPPAPGASAPWQFLAQRRVAIQAAIDIGAWVLGFIAAMLVRFEFLTEPWRNWHLASAMAIAGFLQLVAGYVCGLYVGRWRFGSFEEVAALTRSVVAVEVLFALANAVVLSEQLVPVSVGLAAGIAALLVMAGARYMWRMSIDRSRRPSREGAMRIIVFGAGDGGAALVSSLMRNPSSSYVPVAILDDDPRKCQLRLNGVAVVGDRYALTGTKAKHGADLMVVAIPSASSQLLRELSQLALAADLPMRIVPTVGDLLSKEQRIADIRPVRESDLLGRQHIDTDIASIAGYLNGQRVLVTGAGGSIGSELCRQVKRLGPAALIMIDRDESALHAVQMSLEGRALLDQRTLVVADIRDRDRMLQVFAEHRPDVVFHAAALKHLPLLEMHPMEALKTNIWGTLNVLDAASASGVSRFVNISTDKAADPVSVLGYTKRIAERLTAGAASAVSGTYLSVRFGNVLGSRGSMLGAFEAQVAAGGPITVTHPEVTRFFMTIEEAVQLVVQAGAIGEDGQALVLDMGEPVRISDVARRLAAQSEKPIDIIFTGLRPGEKLHEALFGVGEIDVRPAHPLISHVVVPPVDRVHLDGLELLDDARLRYELRRLCVLRATPPREERVEAAHGDRS